MRNLVIIGAGTGGTIVANKMRRRLGRDWDVITIDPEPLHLYQPGLLFIPFGGSDGKAIQRPRGATLDSGVVWRKGSVASIDTKARRVALQGGDQVEYDILVIASGTEIRPDLTSGLQGALWRERVFDFYTLDGARALRDKLAKFERGRLVLNVVEMPIKCPVAPLEFLFLADAYFTERGIRDQVELVYATPLDKAFTRPIAAGALGAMLERKKIKLETEFVAGEVDNDRGVLSSFDGREVNFDVLVTIPTHSGAAFVEGTGLGDELRFLKTDQRTLAVKGVENVFALGDATNVPASKAGSVAHFQAETIEENLVRATRGEAPVASFDGHANCFVETGFGKAMLIDFNYDVEPLPGHYPVAGVGPFTLLGESRRNHWGKLGFRWLYWNGLLRARPLPVSAHMSMHGKRRPPAQLHA